jgi:hypothetical protein
MEVKPKKCRADGCDNEFIPRKSFDKYCCYDCAKPYIKPLERQPIERKTPIKAKRTRIQRTPVKAVSTKQKKLLAKYHRIRLAFLNRPENKVCPVTKQPTTEVHHKQGRVGYADEFARDNDIPLLLDERFFLGVSRSGHRWIEEHPEQAKERGWSVNRL